MIEDRRQFWGRKLFRKPPAAVTAAIIVIGAIAALAADLPGHLPGHLSYDSVIQLLEGRNGLYGTWHPPVMSWLLGLGDAVVPGTGVFVFFSAAVAFAAFLSLLWLGRATWIAAAVAAVCVISPQFLIYQGIVWKDVLFANAAVAGFVLLAHAAQHWDSVRTRIALIAAAFAFFTLAALARQNGVVAVFAGAVGLGWIAAKETAAASRWRPAIVYGGAVLCGALIIGALAGAALNARTDADPDEWGPIVQTKTLQDYDIVAMVAEHPGLELPQLEDTEPELAQAIRKDGVRLYTPQRNDTLASSVPLQKALANSDASEVRDQWTYLVLHHPWLYLSARAKAFAWVAFTPDIERCVPFAVGVGGPVEEMRRLGLKPRLDARDRALRDYADLFVGTPVLSHITYGLVAIAALFLLLSRRNPVDIAMASMLAGAFLFVLTFFVISLACDYRYLYVLDLSAMFAAFYIALNPALLSGFEVRQETAARRR
jgi:hypothetical protein